MDERRFGAGLAGRLEHVQRAERVDLEIEKGNGSGAVVRGLGGGVDDEVGLDLGHQGQQGGAVADIDGGVAIAGNSLAQHAEYPTGVAFGAEEDGAVVAVDSGDAESLAGKKQRHFGADQPAGTGNQNGGRSHKL